MSIEALLFGQPKSVIIDPNAAFLVQGASFSDLSANGAVPTITGNPVPGLSLVEGPFGHGSLDFVNGRATYPMANLLTQNFFMEMWVKFKPGFNATWSHLMGQGNGVNPGTWAFGPSGGKPTLSIANSNGVRLIVSATSNVVTGNWNYLSLARRGSTFYVFSEGRLQNSGAAGYSLDANQALTIGDRMVGDSANNYPLLGYIGGVRIAAGTNLVVPTATYSVPTAPWL